MNKLINNIKDHTDKFKNEEIKDGKNLALISYIGPISLLTLLLSNNKYVNYHSKQGIRLFLVYSIILCILSILSNISILWRIIDILISIIIILSILLSLNGIINVLNNKAKELPLINIIFSIKK